MTIEIRLDVMLAMRKMSLTELANRIGISVTNLSLLKTGSFRWLRSSPRRPRGIGLGRLLRDRLVVSGVVATG